MSKSEREAALEEAAQYCEAQAFAAKCADDTMRGVREAEPYEKMARAIRALASATPKPAAEDAEQYPGANPDCVWCDGGKRLPKKLYETKLKTPGGAPIYICAGCQAPAAAVRTDKEPS